MRSTGTLLCLGSGRRLRRHGGASASSPTTSGATVGTLLAVRFALAAALFWALVLAGGAARELRALSRRDVGIALGLGACGYAAQAGCFFAALDRIDASLLSLMLYTFPAMVAVAADRPRPRARRRAALRRARAGLGRPRARARQRRGRRARSARRGARARRRDDLHHLHPRQPGHRGAAGPRRAVRARLHGRGRDPDRRLRAARRAPPGRGDARRLGLAGRASRSCRRWPPSASSSPG